MFFLEGSFGSPLFFAPSRSPCAAPVVLYCNSLRVHSNFISVLPEPGGSFVTIQDDCNRRDAGSPVGCSRGSGANGCEPQDHSGRRPGGMLRRTMHVEGFPAP